MVVVVTVQVKSESRWPFFYKRGSDKESLQSAAYHGKNTYYPKCFHEL